MSCLEVRTYDLWKHLNASIRASGSLCFYLAFCVAGVAQYSSPAVSADAVTSTANVTIERAVSGISLSSNFLFGAPVSELSGDLIDFVDTAGPSDGASFQQRLRTAIQLSSTIQPARFSVFGSPNQVFAITLPQTVLISGGSDSESIAVSGFLHDAGATPIVGSSGVGSISVGATVEDNVGASDSDSIAEDTAGAPRNPFDFDSDIPGFMNVSISYN